MEFDHKHDPASPVLTLVSHELCPYVQRAAIALAEKNVPFERVYVDLGNKPDWFKRISPLGKVPCLIVTDRADTSVIFESAVILEYLEETQAHPLHPADPLVRAEHRSWIEFGSAVLNGIAQLYNAKTVPDFDAARVALATRFARLEAELERRGRTPYFEGVQISLVDAVYGPIFRYFDTFERQADLFFFNDLPRIAAWRAALNRRESVRGAVSADYPRRLTDFLVNRKSAISSRIAAHTVADSGIP